MTILIKRDRLSAAAQCIDVAGFGIDSRRRPADAVRGTIAWKIMDFVPQDPLAGMVFERHDASLQIGAAAGGVLNVDRVPHHDRRRASAIRYPPEKVLAVQRPSFDQTC